MAIQKHNSSITAWPKSSLSEILKSEDKPALIRYVSQLSAKKLTHARLSQTEVQNALEYLEKKVEALRAELVDMPPAIREMDADQALADITLLVMDCEDSLSMSRELSVQQIQVIAVSLQERMAMYTMEDVALVLHRGRCGDFGQLFKFDLNTVQTWVNQYLKEVSGMVMAYHQNNHLASKSGMSYDPRDKASVTRVSRDRGIATEGEAHYQEAKADWLEARNKSEKPKSQ